MEKTPLRKVSLKQAALDAEWHVITDQKAKDLGYICQWCGETLAAYCGYSYDGHHIIKRSHGRIDTYENCYVCRRACHRFIEDNNIDVSKYPNQESWNRRGNAKS